MIKNLKCKKCFGITIALLMFVCIAPAATNIVSTVTATNIPVSYIVTLRREADQDGCANDHQLMRKMQWHHALNGFVAELNDAAVQRLKQDKRVLAVESNGKVVPCLVSVTQFPPSGVVRIGVVNFPGLNWNPTNAFNTDGSSSPGAQFPHPGQPLNVDVAVLDSGIDTNHPDLAVYQSVGLADPGLNGQDWSGHGTEVAGIIGALNNNFGVIGVAPAARLWSVQVIGPTQSSWTNVLAGLDYIAQHANQISVVNASLGPASGSTGLPVVAVHQAIYTLVNQGVVVVAAAGNNNGQDIAGPDGILSSFDTNGNPLTVSGDDIIPGSLPEVMDVSAMDPKTDTIAGFSQSSSVPKVPSYVNSPGLGIDVAAPGVNIFSTDLSSGRGYTSDNSGTSYAAPHVTGLIALYIAANGRATNAAGVYKIRQAIIDSALPQSQWNTNNTHDPDGHPEPLVMASTNWIPMSNIVGQSKTNGTVQLNFAAVPDFNYVAQYNDSLSSGQWTNLSGSVIGIGSVAPAQLNDTKPNPSSRFYRLAMSPAPAAIVTTNATSVAAYLNGYGYGIVTNQSGVVNHCVRFVNGNLSESDLVTYVDVPPFFSGTSPPFGSTLNPKGAFTVEFWAKPAQVVNDLFCPAASFDNSLASVTNGWIFYLTSSNQWQFSVGGGTNGMAATVIGGMAQANVWQHVAGVYDGANISLFVNGALVAGPSPASNFSPNLSQPLRFGAASDGTRTFDGWLDEPAVYTNALSATQISAHYSAATTNKAGYASQILGDGPVGYWHFD